MPLSRLVAYCSFACVATAACATFQLKRYSNLCEYKAHGGVQCLPRPFHLTIAGLTLVLALLGLIVEVRWGAPVHMPLCGLERCINIWSRLLTRVWGRSFFYGILAIMEFSHGTIYGHLAGGVLCLAALLSLAVSWTATRKLHRLRARLLDEWKARPPASWPVHALHMAPLTICSTPPRSPPPPPRAGHGQGAHPRGL